MFTQLDKEWMLAYISHSQFKKIDKEIVCSDDIKKFLPFVIPASVPGNFELDLFMQKLIPDPYFGTNIWKMQEFEAQHVFYFCKFEYEGSEFENIILHFDGIDTFSDIYINSKYVGSSENMFIAYEFSVKSLLVPGENELVVHIRPACIEARKYTLPASAHALPYNYDSLYLRKAAHSFGWDIMPRLVSCGIWKKAFLIGRKTERIKDIFCYTRSIDTAKKTADVSFVYNLEISDDLLSEYSLKIEGVCCESSFTFSHKVRHTDGKLAFRINDCLFWFPKNAGDANLYSISVTLYKSTELVDMFTCRFGVRTLELVRTSTVNAEGEGEFLFKINGKSIFCLGTNWVPLDAFHSNDFNRMGDALLMLDDIGCNMVRCWGGNVYERDVFFDFCDAKGIMVWQDFMMGCGVYPMDDCFAQKIKTEAEHNIKRLRNHASLALWAGDNECDQSYCCSFGSSGDPNDNIITRKILPEMLRLHDMMRPYLPSSPYIDENAYKSGEPISEDHLWGPRDYFKGEYYRKSVCRFASETGYHGCPSPESLERFISKDSLWPIFKENGDTNEEWLAHAASPEPAQDAEYAYRIRLMANQVKTLFSFSPDNLKDFALMSQISQAEAKKYFIERFRVAKWNKTGILWWNLLDGWPQISDAVVDYYFSKKLAYHYIKASQQPLCLIMDEPKEGILSLYCVNDLPEGTEINYAVKNVTQGKLIHSATREVAPDSNEVIFKIPHNPDKKEIFLFTWETSGGIKGKNHYTTNAINLDFQQYVSDAKKCGLLELQGF